MKFAASCLIALSAIVSISTVDSASAAINDNGDVDDVDAQKFFSVDSGKNKRRKKTTRI